MKIATVMLSRDPGTARCALVRPCKRYAHRTHTKRCVDPWCQVNLSDFIWTFPSAVDVSNIIRGRLVFKNRLTLGACARRTLFKGIRELTLRADFRQISHLQLPFQILKFSINKMHSFVQQSSKMKTINWYIRNNNITRTHFLLIVKVSH